MPLRFLVVPFVMFLSLVTTVKGLAFGGGCHGSGLVK